MAQELQSAGTDVFQAFRNEVDRLFSQFAGTGFPTTWGGRTVGQIGQPLSIVPPAEAIEDDAAYRIITEIPGVDQKNVEINVSGSVLTLRAERRQEEEQKGRNYLMRERAYGTLQREFRLPDDVDRNRITAENRNGVLTLTLPKSQESRDQRRRIEIKTA